VARSVALMFKMHVATPLPAQGAAVHLFVFARAAPRDALHLTLAGDAAAADEASEEDEAPSAATPLPRGLHAALRAGMRSGGRRKAVLPPSLGYGAAGVRRQLSARHAIVVPPNATLLFFLETLPSDVDAAAAARADKQEEQADDLTAHEEL
jgi:hypothetical protein